MLSLRRGLLIFAALAATTAGAFGKESLAFTVSMPQPSNHTFHVIFRCEGLKGELFINDLMTAKMPGETIHVNIVRGGVGQVLPVQLGQNIKRTYSFHAIPNPSATQAAILEDWLRTAQ